MPRVPPMPRGERARALSRAQPTTCAATTLLARAFRPRSCACPSCIPRLPRWRPRFWCRCSTRAQPDRSLYRARRMRRFLCCVPRSLRCWCAVSSTAGMVTLRRSTLPMPSITRRVKWARLFRRCSQGFQLPMAILLVTSCPSATSLACAMAGFSATTCCAIFRPFKRVGMLAAQRKSTPCAPPSTASKCARCLLNAWRRALPGSCSRCWSTCSPNRPSSTCSIIACSMW